MRVPKELSARKAAAPLLQNCIIARLHLRPFEQPTDEESIVCVVSRRHRHSQFARLHSGDRAASSAQHAVGVLHSDRGICACAGLIKMPRNNQVPLKLEKNVYRSQEQPKIVGELKAPAAC